MVCCCHPVPPLACNWNETQLPRCLGQVRRGQRDRCRLAQRPIGIRITPPRSHLFQQLQPAIWLRMHYLKQKQGIGQGQQLEQGKSF